VLLSGCFKTRVNLTVSKDGSITGTRETLLLNSMLDIDGSGSDTALNSWIAQEQQQYPDSVFTPIEEGEGDNLYKGFRMTNIDTSEYKVTREKNTITFTYKMDEALQDITDMMGEFGQTATLEELKKSGAESTITITMPQKIESANIGTVDGKTVTVDLFGDNGGAKELVVVSKATDYLGLLVYAGIGVAALIAVFLILRSRGSKA
jgi:hypothetical protein